MPISINAERENEREGEKERINHCLLSRFQLEHPNHPVPETTKNETQVTAKCHLHTAGSRVVQPKSAQPVIKRLGSNPWPGVQGRAAWVGGMALSHFTVRHSDARAGVSNPICKGLACVQVFIPFKQAPHPIPSV